MSTPGARLGKINRPEAAMVPSLPRAEGPPRLRRPLRTVLTHPSGYLKRRFQRWFESRLPFTDQIVLTQRNVYILPTRPGLMLGITLLVLLVASINYQLNLGYLLTFLLAGCALVGMHVCHATLRGLAMNLVAPKDRFAGATALIDIKLTNERGSVRHGIGLGVINRPDVDGQGSETHWTWTDVPAQGSSTVQIAFTPQRRGLQCLPTLTAETGFPLGTFRVWTVWRPAVQIMVYPMPELHPPPLPPGEPRHGGEAIRAQAQSSGEFDGVRGYRRGDASKLIVWKKAAKSDGHVRSESAGLVVRDTQQAQRHELWLDFTTTGSADTEHRLSRLCAWVLQAEKLGLNYGLRLPPLEIKPASGEAHKRQCLEALALC
jgi:uncharacterized protein (DUF58 family)